MLHIALNHWKTADWLRVQVSQIRRFAQEPIRIVVCVEDIPTELLPDVDEVVEGIGGNHAGKLNLLGHHILEHAQDETDGLVFLSATMLPIADRFCALHGEERLATIADEPFYPPAQPHPVFCSTTVGLWRELPGDWAPGYLTMPGRERNTMPGANLVDRLQHRGAPWGARVVGDVDASNPASYATFGKSLYHHGSLVGSLTANGFAEGDARAVAADIKRRLWAGDEANVSTVATNEHEQ